jgi:Domain of unknown function (DUF4124)
MWLWIVLVWLFWASVSPALAELYRWTDATGKVHITDNLATIPPAYRERARASGSGTPAFNETPDADSERDRPPPQPSPTQRPSARSAPASQAATPSVSSMRPQIVELEQKIAMARQERQTYLERLDSERAVHAMPVFVRQRRQIAEWGRALLMVEQQLDTFYDELEQARKQFQAQQAAPPERQDVVLDNQGRDATYWQSRSTAIRDQMQQAQTLRRDLLTQLAATTVGDLRTVERQGGDILRQARSLQQVDQEIDATEAAMEAMRQEAFQAGAPAEWLQ